MSVLTEYRKLRGTTGFVGRDAVAALQSARTIEQFKSLESGGLVKIEAEDDPDVDLWEHFDDGYWHTSASGLSVRLSSVGLI